MRRVPALCAVAAAVGLALGAAGDASADRTFKKGPYLQNVTPTAITIMWEPSGGSKPGILRISGPDVEREIKVTPARVQEIVVTGLAPSTRYAYSVEIDGVVANGELATSPEEGSSAPFTFGVYGDTRDNHDQHRRVVDRIRNEVPDFLLGTGDLVYSGAVAAQWQAFFDIERLLLRDNVFFPAVGNHDRQGKGRTADAWRAYFSVPENSPDPERYYAFTYGNSRFLVTDSNMHSFALSDQTAWLESQLQEARQDARIKHIFVTMHAPPFSIALHGGQRDLRERWTPLYEKYGVDAVFSGHDHCYSRAEVGGVRYFVSGGGGAPLYPRAQRIHPIDRAAVKFFERVLHFLRVHVYGDQVEVSAVRVDGSVIETTTWGDPPPPPEPAAVVAVAADSTPAPVATAAVGAPVEVGAMRRGGRGLRWPLGIGMIAMGVVLGVGWAVSRRRPAPRRRRPPTRPSPVE